MPRRKFIDKKNATTFALVHRAGDDPLIHDSDAPSMVFAEKATAQPKALRRARDEDYAYSSAGSVASGSDPGFRSSKVRQRGDLEDEFGLSFKTNEGEAAQHGIFYDDTEYDYMQHMRDLGAGGGGSVMWVEASAPPQAKRKQKLEDALRNIDLDERSVGTAESNLSNARSLLPEEVLPSEFVKKRTYQDQQDVPDDIAGFQPDMDPRLREVLEALEDEEYVDDADEDDIFGQLVEDGEVDEDEFDLLGEQMIFDDGDAAPGALDDDDGWESDDTIKAPSPPPAASLEELKEAGKMIHAPSDSQAQLPADPTEGAWLDEYKKFKTSTKKQATGESASPAAQLPLSTTMESRAPTSRTNRKSLHPSTNFSMTSSTLSRTAHQQLLDARFDKLESDYATSRFPDDEFNDAASGLGSMASGVSGVSGLSAASGASRMSTLSQARASGPKSVRTDFDGMIDDFLSSTGSGKGAKRRGIRRGKVGNDGLKELDEIRQGLGPARLKSKSAASGNS
jgi:protein LTV1